jgi:hypothetical protein
MCGVNAKSRTNLFKRGLMIYLLISVAQPTIREIPDFFEANYKYHYEFRDEIA